MQISRRVSGAIRFGSCVLLLAMTVPEARANGEEKGPGEYTATATLYSCRYSWLPIGTAFLQERPSTEGVKLVDVVVQIRGGLESGRHAVHIHETANCHPCSAARGHFDPGPHSNSSPDGNHPFHAGDLVNIGIDHDGRGTMLTSTSRVSLSDGPLSVFDRDGSAIIIHTAADTFCPDGVEAGCAGGARAACGVIESPKEESHH